ncbi:MAG TPA: glycerol-3-phosphate acyltransferase [Acidimicrobiia bacterium]|nr:glycerol-3-phosphate acyltransferase [Acidimicrobiia bacterium]
MLVVGVCVLSFLAGSVPFSNLVARRRRGVDLRETGSGTVSGTSLYRVAGFKALAFAGILDVAKGAVGPLLLWGHPIAAGIAGGLAVAGHNWSPFLRGHGGRGLAPALGSLLVNAWPGAVLLLAVLVAGRAFRQTGLGAFLGEVLLTPMLVITNGTSGAVAGGAIAAPMLVKRVVGNGRPPERTGRAYLRRLLYDHDLEPT